MDERTSTAFEQFDLPGDPTELKKFIDEHWMEIDKKDMFGDDAEKTKRRLYAMLLDRAVGADLEGNVDAVLDGAKVGRI